MTKIAKNDKKANPYSKLFQSRPRNHKIGGHIQPKRDLTRYVKWPKYILLQRQKKILLQRLKVPGVINQFSFTLSKDQLKGLTSLLKKYKPEDKKQKRERLVKEAEAKAQKQTVDKKKPLMIKCGLNHVTTLVEQRKAQLVVIAADVDPIELVLWLPHLCKKQQVPYCIVGSKALLGQFVGKKTATCLALTEVRTEDKAALSALQNLCLSQYNNDTEKSSKIGNIVLGKKAQQREEAEKKLKEKEIVQKAKGKNSSK